MYCIQKWNTLRLHTINTVIIRHGKILNTVIYFTTLTSHLASQTQSPLRLYWAHDFFSHKCKFPSFYTSQNPTRNSFVYKHTDQHFYTNAALPSEPHYVWFYKFHSFIFSPLLLNPSSTCKAHWDTLFKSTNGRQSPIFTSHTWEHCRL